MDKVDRTETPTNISNRPRRLRRAGAIAGAGLLASLIAAGLGSVASAQSVEITELEPVAQVQVDDDADAPDGDFDSDHGEEFGLSPEDQAVFERYDQCLTEAGLDFETLEETGELDEVDDAAVDAAFAQCDPILDELSAEAQELFGEFEGELSAADEAVFERYDQCLTDAGLGDDAVDGDGVDDAAIDAAFAQCDPILDELSAEAQELFGECPDE